MTPGERLENYLSRFFSLRQYGTNSQFNDRLNTLRRCQTERIRTTHEALFADPKLNPALEFIVTDIYGGEQLLAVAKDIKRALPKAQKLLPQRVFATSATALETALVTQELDEAMVDLLGAQLDSSLSNADYIDAYRKLGQADLRQRQTELVAELGVHLERYLRNRLLLTTFKMVKKPAHKRGFEHLYQFMERCFEVMKFAPNVDTLLAGLSYRETVIMQQIFNGDENPLVYNRQAS